MAFPMLEPEIDILVSKLLSFKTFGNFLRISFLWRRRKQRRKKRKIFGEDLSKKCQRYWEVSVLVSVSRLLPIFLWFRFRFQKNWYQKKSIGFGFDTFANFFRVLVLVSENLVLEKSLGFGFGKFGFGKKSRFRFRKNLVSEKSLSLGFGKFGLGKKSRFWFRKIWSQKRKIK